MPFCQPRRYGPRNTAVHRIGYRHRQQRVVCPQVQMPAAHPIHPDRNRIPCPIIPPGRTSKRLFANLSPPASHPSWAMPCCARAWVPRTGSPLATGPNSSFRCPRPRQAATSRISPHGSTRPIPAPACLCSVYHPMRRQGGSTGCAACQPFSGCLFPFSCPTPHVHCSHPQTKAVIVRSLTLVRGEANSLFDWAGSGCTCS